MLDKEKIMAQTSKLKAISLNVILLACLFIAPLTTHAQNTSSADLNVSSWALKGGVFSFLNNLQHKVRYLVTWNPNVQTKMNITKANESLAVAQLELAKTDQSPETQQKFQEALDTYNNEMSKIAERTDKFKKRGTPDNNGCPPFLVRHPL